MGACVGGGAAGAARWWSMWVGCSRIGGGGGPPPCRGRSCFFIFLEFVRELVGVASTAVCNYVVRMCGCVSLLRLC